jgi:hypothetical protein
MKHYIKYSVTETRIVELKREPTPEEIELINHKTEGSMYDTGDDLIDWDTEDVCDADHHWVKLFINGHEVIQ